MRTIAIILAIIAFTTAQNEGFYTTLVYMAQHKIGYDEAYGCGQNALLNYLQEVFEVDNETHEQALREARNMESPVVHLDIGVLEGKDLAWKDPNGKSDPFCTLYVESSPTLQYNTAVKNQTLTPIWNEYFELPMRDAENDVLWLMVWDLDPEETFSEKIKQFGDVYGVKGFFRLAHEITVSGITGNPEKEFIGSCKIAIKDIKLTGQTSWYVIKNRKATKVRGHVRLRLGFSMENNTEAAIQEHRRLLRNLLLHELKTEKPEKYCWWGTWSPAAGTLVNQHRARKGLLRRNVALSEWIEYSSIHEEHPLHFVVFNKLANELLQPITDGLFSSDDVTLFWEGARKVLYSCFDSIREIEKLPKCKMNPTEELTDILRIISAISSLNVPENFQLFPAEMYNWLSEQHDTKIDVLQMLEYTVRENGDVSWNNLLQDNTVETASDQNGIESRIEIIQLAMAELQRASKVYDDIFIEHDPPLDIDDLRSMKIHNYHEWFRCGVPHWLELLMYDAEKKIERSMELDKLDKPRDSRESLESTSADAVWIIYEQMMTFWTQMAWPDIEESLAYFEILVDRVCKCSVAYVDMILTKVKNVTQMSTQPDTASVNEETFHVSRAWCFGISNIDYVKKMIGLWADDDHLRKLVNKLRSNDTQRDIDCLRKIMKSLIDNTINVLENKIAESFEDVGNQIVAAISGYLMEGVEPLEAIRMRNSMRRFDDYIEDNMRMLGDNLNKDNFQRIGVVIWGKLLETMFQLINRNLNKDRPPLFYAIFDHILRTLVKNFSDFHENETAANADVLKKMQKLLEFYSMPTADLIHLYHIGRIQEQKDLHEPIDGILAVRALFVYNTLIVEILNWRNLRSPDSCDENNRFVKLRMLTEKKFIEYAQRETDKQKATSYSLFDATFDIPLTTEQRRLKDGILVFELMIDESIFTKDTFVAEAFLPFSEIPVGDHKRDMKSLKQILLNLSRPGNTTSDIVTALEHRKSDKEAKKFIAMLAKKKIVNNFS